MKAKQIKSNLKFYIKLISKSCTAKIFAITRRFLTRKTPRVEIENLIKSLYPIITNKALIRLGGGFDGGYIVPDDLEGIKACFSPGVGTNSQFEYACANLGMLVFLADQSVDQPSIDHPRFSFTKKFIGGLTNDKFMTLDNWVDAALQENTSELILQMDIEGSEYEALLSASEALLQRFRIIVIEFHHLDELWNKVFFKLANSVFNKITQTHTCLHIHPNNYASKIMLENLEIPGVMEFTFLRNDRISESVRATKFPNMLDKPNASDRPDIILPKCWHG